MSNLNRRDFHRLSIAALSGALAGAAGCGASKPEGAAGPVAAPTAGTTSVAELHVCRGLNTCAGLGSDGKNSCAGQGTCASAAARHDCGGENSCKNLGGCGTNPGRNDCKGTGGCHVPLMDHAWKDARKHFEAKMKEAGKEVGLPPA